jgi:streptogrisin D
MRREQAKTGANWKSIKLQEEIGMDFRFALRRGSHSRLRPCLVAGVLLVAVTLGLPASASGAPSKPGTSPAPNEIPADVRASMAAQAPLVKASDEIQRAVEKAKATGFTGVAIEGDKLVLWWKARAPMPSAVAAAAATARRTAKLERRSAPYALGELRAASDRMLAQIQANPSGPVFGVAIPADGTGLIVNADRQIVNANPNTTRSAMATTAASTLARAARVQVPVTTVVQSRPQPASRAVDTPPFRGGAGLQHVPTAPLRPCTSGFGVADFSGFHYLLTARHCFLLGEPVYNGFFTQFVGFAAAERADHDFMLIGTPSAQGRIYDGPVGTGEFEKPVIGYGFTTPGQHVCFSGSVTGAICNIFNSTAMSNSLCYTDIFGRGTVCVNDLVLAAHATGQRICQGGDSGGPVFDLRNPNWNNVVARGIGSFCNTVQGGNRMLYGKFSNAVNDFGIGPLTSS